MNNLSNQKKGSLMAFVAVIFITPDSLFIRLPNASSCFYSSFSGGSALVFSIV